MGGSITGLTAAGLQLANGLDTLSPLSGATTFTFGTALANGAPYGVTVTASPAGLLCAVAPGTGSGVIAGANVTSVVVACVPAMAFALGGSVTGLNAGNLELLEGDAFEFVTVPAGSTSFAFADRPLGSTYSVEVATQPAGLFCTVMAGTGTVLADVNNIAVSCTVPMSTVGGAISGLPPAAMLLVSLNAGGPNVTQGNGPFTFPGAYAPGFAYNVVVGTSPPGLVCLVNNGVGVVGVANINNVDVACTPPCGNRRLDVGETCDEGDTTAGDGCDGSCQLEMPAIGETEPNEDGTPSTGGVNVAGNDFSRTNANPVVLGDLVLAHFGVPGDEDVYAFTNLALQARYVRVFTSGVVATACPPGLDTGINVWDAAGTAPIANNDDIGGGNFCSRVTVSVPTGATLYFHVTEYQDNDLDPYRLHVVDDGFCGDGTINGPPGTELCEPPGTAACTATCQPTNPCGNGVLDVGEQCDDGLTQIPPLDGDGCSALCQLEPGFATETEPNDDGVRNVNGGNGNDFLATAANGPFDAVNGTVTIIAALSPAGDEDGFAVTNSGTTPVLLTAETFGPGGVGTCVTTLDTEINIRNAAGAELANDDESGINHCSLETFGIAPNETIYVHVIEFQDNAAAGRYLLQLRFRAVVCGDGIIEGGEQCDDGLPAANGDGCSASCAVELGFACTNVPPPSVCRAIVCGDGIIEGAEVCDDGQPAADGDGCSVACTIEPGYFCSGVPSMCTSGVPAYFLPCGPGETRRVNTFTGPPLSIPDNTPAGVTSVVTVAGQGTIVKAAVWLDITHTYDGDLDIGLRAPGAAVDIELSTDNGASGENYRNTILDAACAAPITAGTPPYAGCFQPEGLTAFTALNGTPADGAWTLRVVDDASVDVGTVNTWALVLCTTP